MRIDEMQETAKKIISLIDMRNKPGTGNWSVEAKACLKEFHDAYHKWEEHDIGKEQENQSKPKTEIALVTDINEIKRIKTAMDIALRLAFEVIVNDFKTRTGLPIKNIDIELTHHIQNRTGQKEVDTIITGVKTKVEI